MSLILSGSDGVSDIDGTVSTPAIRGTDSNTGIFFPAADTIAFSEGGAEAMRIDSSGRLGIGTSSPDTTTLLTVAGAVTITGANSGHGASRLKLGQDTTAISQIRFYGADNSTPGVLQFTASSADGNVGGERLRITANGTLQQTLNPLFFNIDASPCTATVTNGSSINFGTSYSGVIFANDTSSSGETAVLTCGGGVTSATGSSQFTNTSGSGQIRFYNSGAGYVLQNNSGGTVVFGLFVVRTRAGT